MKKRKALHAAAFLTAVTGATILGASAAAAAPPERKFCDYRLADLPESTCHDSHTPKEFGTREKKPTPYTS